MSGIGTYDGKDTRTIKLPATSRLVSFADVDHDKNNDDDRTTCSTSSTSVCNDIEIWKMSEEVANEQTGGVCPIVEALLSPVQEFECPASTKEKIKDCIKLDPLDDTICKECKDGFIFKQNECFRSENC